MNKNRACNETPEDEPEPEGSVEALQHALKEKEQALAKAQDELLRARAELQNQAKRAERNVEDARKYGVTRLLEALLPLRDSMELAIEAAREKHRVKPLLEGNVLNLKTLDSILKNFGVELIEPEKGEDFDPNLHEAISEAPSSDVSPDSILQTHQKGASLNGRVIRPARVTVSKAAPDSDEETESKNETN